MTMNHNQLYLNYKITRITDLFLSLSLF